MADGWVRAVRMPEGHCVGVASQPSAFSWATGLMADPWHSAPDGHAVLADTANHQTSRFSQGPEPLTRRTEAASEGSSV